MMRVCLPEVSFNIKNYTLLVWRWRWTKFSYSTLSAHRHCVDFCDKNKEHVQDIWDFQNNHLARFTLVACEATKPEKTFDSQIWEFFYASSACARSVEARPVRVKRTYIGLSFELTLNLILYSICLSRSGLF